MEDIFENYLTENIPPDLLAAYKRSEYHISNRPERSQHYQTEHGELAKIGNDDRRLAKWDYGKSTYKVITPEEAKQMVKNDRESVENLRLLYHGTLLEYEVRSNNSIYAIYGPGGTDDPVTITNPDGTSREYPNLRFIPFNKMLYIADKIYVTDEYEHPVSDEKKTDREAKNKRVKIDYSPRGKGEEGYEDHDASANWKAGKHYDEPSVADTGKHESPSSDVRKAFKDYSDTRKALKRLDREKADLDADDYDYQKERLTKRLKDQKDAYDQLVNENSRKYDHVLKRASEESAKLNQKLRTYIDEVTIALNTSHKAKRKAEEIQAKLPSYNKYTEQTLITQLPDIINRLEELQNKLNNARDGLEDDMNGFEFDIEDQHASPEELNNQLDAILNQYEVSSEAQIKEYLNKLKQALDEMNKADAKVAELRPHETARKAAKRNAEAKLDPSLADIIDFVEFA